jgi:hypothetical protein
MPTPLPQVIQQQTVSYQNFRVGDGNPNAIGQYGQPGWTYQDWANGRLYIYSNGSWRETLIVGGSSTGNVGDILWHGSNGWLHRRYIEDEDLVPVISWQATGRVLFDNQGVESVDFSTRQLLGSSGTMTVDWNAGLFVYDSANTKAIEIDDTYRNLNDFAATVSINFGGRYLTDTSGSPVLTWDTSLDGFVTVSNNQLPVIDAKPIAAVGVTEYDQPSATASYDLPGSSASQMTLFLSSATARTTLNLNIDEWLTYVPTGSRLVIFARSAVTTINLTHPSVSRLGAALTTLAAGASAEFIIAGNLLLRIR